MAFVKHDRKSIRIPGYNYGESGAYFITICSYQHQCIFGKITDGEMKLNEYGKIVESEWLKSPTIRREIELDEYVIMPNHVHGIVRIVGWNERSVGANGRLPLPPGYPPPVWQRNYYEHIIRNDHALSAIRKYIIHNPSKWGTDRNKNGIINI